MFWTTAPSIDLSLHSWGGGGGYLAYLSDGDMPFFRVTFSPIFSRQGINRMQVLWAGSVVKGKFCKMGLLYSPIFVFLYYHRIF